MARKTMFGLLGLLGLLGCGASPVPSALVVAPNAALPAELIGEFACTSEAYRARLTVRADGRFRETDRSILRDGGWQSVSSPPPCDPWGWARFDAGGATLTLDEQSATCEELGDPITIPRVRRTLVLRRVDARGFATDTQTCERVAAAASSPRAFPL